MPPTFLNSREDALLVWLLLILAFAIYKSPRSILGGFLAVLRAFLQPKVFLLDVAALGYCSAAVYGAHELGLWHWGAFKETLYWVIGTVIVLVGNAVMQTSAGHGDLLRRVLKKVIAITVFAEFAANLYAFPLALELVATFVILAFTGMQAIAPYQPSIDLVTRKLIDGVLVFVGLVYMAYFVIRAIGDDELLTSETAEEFLAGPMLTLVLIPFLFLLVSLSRREQEISQRRWRADFNSPAR